MLVLAALLAALASPAVAQSERPGDVFYGKIGAGIADYTGDYPAQNTTHPFDFQEFRRGSGLPLVVAGEVGYQFSPKWALALGFQGGNYPISGYGGGPSGSTDSYRYTPQLLGRYTFGGARQRIAPYLDVGVNATFGGDTPPTNVGVGPSVGGGVDVRLGRALSVYVESRFNATLPDDAMDGASTGGPFDLANQLLGFGLKVHFAAPTPPRVITLDGPATAQAGTPVTFAATANEDAAARPLRYEWTLGDGATGAGPTVTHTYDQPGTYTVTVSASNEAGSARGSTTVEVTRPPRPSTPSADARIASITATPNPVVAGAPVQFRSAVEGGDAPAYEWRFGDGTTATSSAPTHTYERPGRYTVRLRVSNAAGSDTRRVAVRVTQRAGEERAPQWRIVVASMRRQDGAEALARQYRDRGRAGAMPVEIVAAETEEGLRYRVLVGAFETAAAARQAIKEHADDLPSGAWALQLQR